MTLIGDNPKPCRESMWLAPVLSKDNAFGTQIRQGIHLIDHFNGDFLFPGFEEYPEFKDDRSPYGVCDDVDQLLSQYPELEADGREFAVTLTPVIKSEQPETGGWRWHKWGPYIGTQNSQCEYLYDEDGIERVYCYHIYERVTI